MSYYRADIPYSVLCPGCDCQVDVTRMARMVVHEIESSSYDDRQDEAGAVVITMHRRCPWSKARVSADKKVPNDIKP